MSAGLRDVLALAAGGASARVVAARTGLPADLVEAMLDHAGRVGLAEPVGDGAASGGSASGGSTGLGVPSSCRGCQATRSGAGEVAPRRLPLACAGCFFARR